MSIQALNWVLEQSEAKLGGRLVLIAIANHTNKETGYAELSYDTIAAEARLSRRQAIEQVKKLVDSEQLELYPSSGHKGVTGHRLNRYVIVGTVQKLHHSPPAVMPSNGEANGEGNGEANGEASLTHSIEPVTIETKNLAPKPARARNDLLDTLAFIDGYTPSQISNGGVPVGAWGKLASCLKRIKEQTSDVTPTELQRRASNWRRVFPGATLTATALDKHWHRLDSPAHQPGNGKPSPTDILNRFGANE